MNDYIKIWLFGTKKKSKSKSEIEIKILMANRIGKNKKGNIKKRGKRGIRERGKSLM